MTISVEQIRPALPEEWDRIWKACDYATFFHSREWAETWGSYTRGAMRPDPKVVLFSDGKKALLPLSCRSGLRGLVRKYVSSPARTYGGWIASDDLNGSHVVLLFDVFARLRNLVWRTNPYDPRQIPRNGEGHKLDDTYALRLDRGFEAVHKDWSKGHRSAAKQASKLGATVRLATGLDDWHAYFDVYGDTLRRWGDKATSRYRMELFARLHGLQSPHVKLWLAVHADTIVAGALCFYSRTHVAYWHGAALEQSLSIRPTNLLMYEAIRNACEEGYLWFDFNPSGRHEGVKAFKRSFGTQALPCPVVTRESQFTRMARKFGGMVR